LNDNDLDEDEGYYSEEEQGEAQQEQEQEQEDSKANNKENKEQQQSVDNNQETKNESSNQYCKLTKNPSSKNDNYSGDYSNSSSGSKVNIEMRRLNAENNSISTNDNTKSEIKANLNDYVEENPDPSQVCHRIIYKVKI